MSEEKKQEDKAGPVSKYQWLFDWWPLLAVALLILGALGSYAYVFVSPAFPDCTGRWDEKQCVIQSLADSKSSWGQLGDYMGGLVNPVIGLLTIVLLVRSLRQNEKALDLSRKELEATRGAVEQATAAQEKMEQSLKDQLAEAKSQNNFANYYKHLEEFTKYVAEIRELHEKSNYEIEIYHRKLHNVFFPNARTVGVRFDPSIQRALFDSLYDISQLVPLLIGLEREEFEAVKLEVEGVRRLLNIVVVGCVEHKTVSFSKFSYNVGRKGTENIMEGYSLRGAFQQCLWESTVLLELASFDENFDKYSYYIQLINLLKKQVEKSPDKISKHYGIETEGAARRPENSVLHSIGVTIEKIRSEYLKN